jgi:hypothetical protein
VKIRRLLCATVVLTVATALSACGSSSDGSAGSGGSDSGTKLLSASQISDAVISLDDLGPGFKVDKSDDGDNKTSFGCLDSLDKLDKLDGGKFKPVHEKEIDYAADSEIGVPAVFTTVGTFRDQATVSEAVSTVKKALDGCTSVDATDDDGFRVQLKVSVDEKTSGPGATAQVNLTATGTGTEQGTSFPFGIRLTIIQVDNNVGLCALVSFGQGDSIGADADKIASIALERLVAVVAGKKPSPAPANLHVTTPEEMLGSAGGQSGPA